MLTSTIEGPRMRDEEATGFEVVEYPWEQGPDAALEGLVGGASIAADVPLDGASLLGAELNAIQRVLDLDAIARLRGVGADLTSALEEAAGSIAPGISEHQAANEIAASCGSRGLVPTVLLAATDVRIGRYRHPLPPPRPSRAGRCWSRPPSAMACTEPDPDGPLRGAVPRDPAPAGALRRDPRPDAGGGDQARPDRWPGVRRLRAPLRRDGLPRRVAASPPGRDHGLRLARGDCDAGLRGRNRARPGLLLEPLDHRAKAENTFVLTETGPEVVAGAGIAVAGSAERQQTDRGAGSL